MGTSSLHGQNFMKSNCLLRNGYFYPLRYIFVEHVFGSYNKKIHECITVNKNLKKMVRISLQHFENYGRHFEFTRHLFLLTSN